MDEGQKPPDETTNSETNEPRGPDDHPAESKLIQLRGLPGKVGIPGNKPRGPVKFKPGNKAAAGPRRRPANLIEELDQMTASLIRRLAVRITEEYTDKDGKVKRRLVHLDAARANAMHNLLKLRAELYDRHRAGEEFQRLQDELQEMHQVVSGLMAERMGG